jgi:purine nucleoside phosphorylase
MIQRHVTTFEQVEEAAAAVRARCGALPQTAIVLGSGLGDFADTLLDAIATSYGELPHWPASRVVGHAGRLVIGNVGGIASRHLPVAFTSTKDTTSPPLSSRRGSWVDLECGS